MAIQKHSSKGTDIPLRPNCYASMPLFIPFMFIKLRVHPDSKRDKVVKRSADTYEIWTKAQPERGLANAAALRALALALGVDAKKILLIKGARSPSKIVRVL